MQTKTQRHEKIKELIRQYPIDTQEELALRLQKAGFEVTQATVSRDVKSLKLTKVTLKDGGSRYAVLEDPMVQSRNKFQRVLEDAVTGLCVAQNLVVVKTVPGMAMGAATSLDSLAWKEILGCVAGDDTIFCACPSKKEAQEVALRLEQLVGTGSRLGQS